MLKVLSFKRVDQLNAEVVVQAQHPDEAISKEAIDAAVEFAEKNGFTDCALGMMTPTPVPVDKDGKTHSDMFMANSKHEIAGYVANFPLMKAI